MPGSKPSSGQSHALIVAADQYNDPGLSELRSPAQDAEEFAKVLRDPSIGGFTTTTLVNEPGYTLLEEIEGFFDGRSLDDLLLLYISCHGVKDLAGRLYFAASSTKLNRLAASGISADFVYEQVDRCRARKILLLLDCCYSGAYLRGRRPRAVGRAGIGPLTGRGRAVITSSTALEYSFELDTGHVTGKAAPSVFTEALVEGLRTGRADRDRDGLVSVDDLYGYVYERVREVTPHQTPEKKWGEISGDFIVAKNPNPPATSGVPLPGRLIDELRSTDSNLRERAFRELTRLAFGDNEGVAITARETLQVLADDESPVISSAAMAALTESQLAQSAPSRPGRRRRLSLGLIGVSAVSVVLAVVGMALAGVLPNLRHVGDTSGRVPQAGSAMAAGLSALRHYRDVAIQAQERRRIARTTPTVSPSPPPPTVPIASATASIVYEPWTASGRSLVTGIHVLSTQSGADCVGGAESSYRADAYRCFTDGGNIYDPCFADPSFFPVHPQLACPLKAADEVVLIHSAKELPRQSPVDTTRVWMIILSNGETCTFAGGATEEVAGMRLNYDCSDGAYLYGDPVNENGAFSIYRQGPGNPALAKVHVATAYL